jgi:glycosyltransferase involved in cell wall biosynthesis
MEALGAGCPVISTDVGDVALLVKDGVNGRLVAPGDMDGIRAAIEAMMAAPAREAMAARSSIAEFSLEEMRGRYARLFETAAGMSR